MTIHSKEGLERRLALAQKDTYERLERGGVDGFDVVINYLSMTKQQLLDLHNGPGVVGKVAPQTPIHLQAPLIVEGRVALTSDELFVSRYGNFSLRFLPDDAHFALHNRQLPHMRRLRILLPELERAAQDLVADRLARRSKGDATDHDCYAPYMRLMYAVLCKLIDVDDMHGNEYVSDSVNAQCILTV